MRILQSGLRIGSLLVAATLAHAAPPANSYLGSLQIDIAITGFGEQAAIYLAQSFIAPMGSPKEIHLRLASSSGPGDNYFRILITETTGGSGDGIYPTRVVFESETLHLPFDPTYPINRLEFTDFTIPLGKLRLKTGETYAIVLDGFADFDGIGNSAGTGLNNDAYEGGHFFAYGGYLYGSPTTREDHFADTAGWGDSLDRDMAFELTFKPKGKQ